MKRLTPIFALSLATFLSHPCRAATKPTPSTDDPRVATIRYAKDDVATIDVQRGTVTRIVLASEERIKNDGAASGFPADCSRPEHEWCIHAMPGTNQLLIKPKTGATYNNLELSTNHREYSFAFNVLPDSEPGHQKLPSPASRTAMYRVVFTYAPEAGQRQLVTPARIVGTNDGRQISPTNQSTSKPAAKNWNYTMQATPGSADIAPALAFDDCRFTYFSFPANREVPTIFSVSPQGEESRVNFHMHAADPGLVVVQKVSRRFVIRLGESAVGIWNEAFSSTDASNQYGTTVPTIARVVKEHQ